MESSKKEEHRKITSLVTKSIAVKTFMRFAKKSSPLVPESADSSLEDSTHPALDNHNSMFDMMLKDKRDSEMRREMDAKHVRIQTPRRRHLDCLVRREKSDQKGKRKLVKVLRPADPDSVIIWKRVPGPKIGDNGAILSHSLLGDVDSFVAEAKQRGQFQELIHSQEKQEKERPAVPVYKSSTGSFKQLLNEESALTNWELEMFYRKMGQKRLAKIVKRPIKDLLMTRTDDFVRRNEIRNIIRLQGTEKLHPTVCFWTLEPRYGSGQIMTTLTRTERGLINTPMISGDGLTIEHEKGKAGVSVPNTWHDSEYLKKQVEQIPGIIHITNEKLFKNLDVHGTGVQPPKQCNSVTAFQTNVNQIAQSSTDIKQHEDAKVVSHTGTKCLRDKISFQGPSLRIGGKNLHWLGREINEAGSQWDRVVKEEFILIETNVGEIAKSHMTFENNGTVVLKYLWKKESVFHPLPIQRPQRRPFYCFDDAGSVRPGEIIHIPVLFRSSIPGYFTESWLLETIPILEGGAKIRFTLKGVAKDIKDYSRQCQEIEEYLRKKQISTLCYLEAKFILDAAILKASLNFERERDDPIYPTREEQFEELNYGFHFIESVIKELWVLYDIVSKDTLMSNESELMCLSKLRSMVLKLPCPVCDDEDEHFHRQDELFQSFCHKVMLLSFCPLLPWQPRFHQKYIVMYTLIQHGMDEFTHRASRVADTLGLIIEEVLEIVSEVKNNTKSKSASMKAKAKVSTASSLGKGKNKDTKDPSPTHDKSQTPNTTKFTDDVEFPQFSAVSKFKQAHGTKSKSLKMYEERTYLIMYEILLNTMDTFFGFFRENREQYWKTKEKM